VTRRQRRQVAAGTDTDDRAGDHFGPLYLGAFVSYGDRFLIGPLLVVIAKDFDVSLGAAAAVALRSSWCCRRSAFDRARR